MATVKEDVTLKYQSTKDGPIEETQFSTGQEVTVVQTWAAHYLIKGEDGHYYNIPKSKVEN